LIEFQCEPDPIFLAIVSAALSWTREQLYPYLETARPTPEDMQELDENYSNFLYPFMSRTDAITQVDKLSGALHASGLYRLTDYHWLILHESLNMFCDLHNDDEFDGKVGPYVIDKIELDRVLGIFFFDTDSLFGVDFLISDERRPNPVPDVTPQARRIAAGVKPTSEDLELTLIEDEQSEMAPSTELTLRRPYPAAGYIGPYPLREPKADDDL
jgi:hypothetical protein